MFTKGQKDGTVRFSFKAPAGTREVLLAGTFSQWKPLTMRKQRDGSFAVTVAVGGGSHEYKFVVDGNWTTDPDNASYVLNPFGTVNSVAQAA